MKNNFVANLAQSIIDLDIPQGEIKGNYFSNVQSTCDITRISSINDDAVENYWAHEMDAEYRPRICTLNNGISEVGPTKHRTIQNSNRNRDSAVADIVMATMRTPKEQWVMEQEETKKINSHNNSSTLRPFSNTYNQVKAITQPYRVMCKISESGGTRTRISLYPGSNPFYYSRFTTVPSTLQLIRLSVSNQPSTVWPSISSEVAVHPEQIVIVDPGSEFEFAPGIGLTVQDKGKLYLNGTVAKPIRLFGESTWRGLMIKPGGTLVLSHTIIEDASIGLWIDSEKVQLEKARISDSIVHAIEITAKAGADIDFGYSLIERAKGTGVGVDERKSSLTIRNIMIRDGWGSGIDFVSPTGDIHIVNVSVSNGSSYSIHIVEFPAFPLKSVSLRNVTVSDQTRGHAGVLITGGLVEQIDIDQSLFTRNTVPSLIIGVECRQRKSRTHLRNTTFRNNEDLVVHLDVGECGSASVIQNSFLENNKATGHGVLLLNAARKEKLPALPIVVEANEFSGNGGEYAAMLAMHGLSADNGTFRGNRVIVASVIVTSPYYRINANEFSNPFSVHDLDVRSNGSWKVEAIGNNWHTTDMTKAIRAPEGTVKLKADEVLTKPDIQLLPGNSQCAHLNYCSHVGNCQAGVCSCPVNRIGLDCSVVIGCPSNCSNNGVCDVMNKCVCYDGTIISSFFRK
ncbi:hypothetical protein KIN20_006454 [Parelaphostrongylus tenuis]|uniref:Right handed beta helix domain-containing protein n=1 Tax=Parelaphostrongylus tenuis TaxID=148309 RepID=A0AAD5MU54_PARTN|nr:hypothetical protein KIN20_006454 [Parelaphostrongylus tenuis]